MVIHDVSSGGRKKRMFVVVDESFHPKASFRQIVDAVNLVREIRGREVVAWSSNYFVVRGEIHG